MKCLTRIEIQEYLDKELEPSVIEEISGHLKKCKRCLELFREASADKALVGILIGKGNRIDESVPIPGFLPPVLYKKRITGYRLVPYILAASLIGLIVYLNTDKHPAAITIPEAELLMNEFYEGKDLNKLWHERSQIIILQDEKGNVIQSIITN